MNRKISYAEALREAQAYCLEVDPNVYLMGLGAPDPKGIFGSTLGLQERFGKQRVFDIPLSENAITGVALGSAITGMRPILTHQRVDFALVSLEQIVNQAAKWHYMFGGTMSAPIVIRMIIGRGWGQGPQHSQSLHAWFAHIPGLKVILPTTPYDAKGMLIAAIEDNNPVICLEHRWLYGLTDEVPAEDYRVNLESSRVMRQGSDVTLIGVSYMALECLRAAALLEEVGVSAEVIDVRTVRPLDQKTLIESVQKTHHALIVDHGHIFAGISAEIAATVNESLFQSLAAPTIRLGLPDYPTPTSPALSDQYYPQAYQIGNRVLRMVGKPETLTQPNEKRRLDQPDSTFQGPF